MSDNDKVEMPYKYTLQNARDADELAEVAGVCVSSDKFTSLINQAQRLLWRRGDWEDSEWLVRFCITDRCLTLPRYIRTVLGARFCNGGDGIIKNNWYAIIGPHRCRMGCDIVLRDNNTAPCFREIVSTTGALIQYHVTKNEDIGKAITIYGKQYGGQPLQERDETGAWRMGVTLKASNPDARTSALVTKITSITREPTQGMAWLYDYNPTDTVLRDLAAFDPDETNPRLRRMMIENWNTSHSCDLQAEVIVKLAFVPVKRDNDFLMVDNFDALKYAIQSIRQSEADNDELAQVKLLKAIAELNFDLRDSTPGPQLTVEVSCVGKHICGTY